MSFSNGCDLICGYGDCNNGTCVCDPGYLYDLVRHRYDNCFFSRNLQISFIVTNACLSFSLFLYAIYVARKIKSHLRLLASVAGLEGVFVFCTTIGYYIEGGCSFGTWFFCSFCYAPFFSLMVLILCYEVLNPFYKVAKLSTDGLLKTLFVLGAISFAFSFAIGISNFVFLSRDDNYTFNLVLSILDIATTLFATIGILIFNLYSSKLLAVMNSITLSDRLMAYYTHLNRFRIQISVLLFLAFPSLTAYIITAFIISLPYSFVETWFMYISSCLVGFSCCYFVSLDLNKKKSNGTSRATGDLTSRSNGKEEELANISEVPLMPSVLQFKSGMAVEINNSALPPQESGVLINERSSVKYSYRDSSARNLQSWAKSEGEVRYVNSSLRNVTSWADEDEERKG